MKRLLTLLLAAMAVAMNAAAENYPYRSDMLWVTVPDHADWLYDKGEKAKVEVQLYRYGVPLDCTVTYETADDMMPADGKGEAKLAEPPRGYKVLWVLSGRGETLSVQEPWGLVKKLKAIKAEYDPALDFDNVERGGFSMNNQESMHL